MNRLQKKCLLGSGLTHGLLLGFVVVGSAFVTPKPKEEFPVFELLAYPDKIVDENVQGGGEPDAVLPPAVINSIPAPPVVVPQPAVVEPAPQPPKPEVRPEPEPAKPATKPEPEAIKVDTTPKVKPGPKINTTPVHRKLPTDAADEQAKETRAEKRKREAAEIQRVANARQQAISSALGQIQRSTTSSGAKVGMPGPGGASYASYFSVVQKVYEDSWQTPSESMSDEIDVDVQITVAKSGDVLNFKILKKSGEPALDKSVQKVLERVKKLPRFPEGATDEKRIFNIIFNLKASRKLG